MIPTMIRRLRFRWDHRWAPEHMSDYLDGELGAGGRDRIESHVHDCPKCRELLHGLTSILRGLARFREDPEERPEPTVAPKVLAGLREELGKDAGDERDV